MSKKDLKVTVIGENKTGKAFKDAETGATKFAKAAGKAMLAVGAAGIAGVGLSVKAFADFDSKLNQSLAIMGNVSDAMRKEMSDAAREVGKTTKFSASEAAEAYFFLASAGYDAKAAVAAMPQVAKFAQAGMFDMARATDLATDAQSALGLASKDPAENLKQLTRVTDVFVKANTLANTSVEQIAEAMTNKAGAAMKSVGMSIEEGSAVLAAFADVGTKGAEAGTQFAIVLRDLQTKALSNKDAFKKAGVAVFDANGEFRNMGDIMGDLEGHLDGMSDAQKKAALATLGFSDKSMGALQTLMGSSEAIKRYEGELRNAAGTVDEISKKQMETFSAQLGLLKDRLVDVAIEVGSRVVPVLLAMLKAIDKAWPTVKAFVDRGLNAVSNWWGQHGPGITSAATKMGAAVVSTFVAIGKAIGGVVKFFNEHSKAAKALGVLVSAVAATIAAAWVAQGVVATINAAKSVVAWFATATASTTSATIQSKSTAQIVAGWAVQAAKAALNAAKVVAGWVLMGTQSLLQAARMAAAWLIALGPLGWAIAAIVGITAVVIKNWDAIKNATSAAWKAVSGATAAAWDAVKGAVSAAVSFITGLFLNFTGPGLIIKHWATIKAAFSAGVAAIKGVMSGGIGAVVSTIASLPGRIVGALGNVGGLLVNAGRSIVEGLIRGITDKFGALARKASELAQKVKDFLPFSPAKRGPFAGKGNPYYSGLSIGRLVESGLDRSIGGVVDTMQRGLSDASDLAGMKVGGASYVNGRLNATAPSAPVEPAGRNVTVYINGQVERLDEARLMTLLQRAERLAG